jgi:hypothetical protein
LPQVQRSGRPRRPSDPFLHLLFPPSSPGCSSKSSSILARSRAVAVAQAAEDLGNGTSLDLLDLDIGIAELAADGAQEEVMNRLWIRFCGVMNQKSMLPREPITSPTDPGFLEPLPGMAAGSAVSPFPT